MGQASAKVQGWLQSPCRGHAPDPAGPAGLSADRADEVAESETFSAFFASFFMVFLLALEINSQVPRCNHFCMIGWPPPERQSCADHTPH